ncbi:hypothetical protein LCGC14_1914100 [marine sediment metagenome]|uniref:Uncharacterized protein n=1 Tax=marine sediment metagenome TaxID=412755 RepID=A0A0F9IQS4_9ZZZZ
MLELTFRHDGHVTKNTYRFEEISLDTNKPRQTREEWAIGKLYIQKRCLPEPCPDEITVKVEW